MKDMLGQDLKLLRLDMIDRLEPYGVTSKELIPFDDELRALVDLPSKQREKQFNKLADKIRTYYKKQKRVR
jgi:hypothetical protein